MKPYTIKFKEDVPVGGLEEHYSTYRLVDNYGHTLYTGSASVLAQGLIMPETPGIYYLILGGKAGKETAQDSGGAGVGRFLFFTIKTA